MDKEEANDIIPSSAFAPAEVHMSQLKLLAEELCLLEEKIDCLKKQASAMRDELIQKAKEGGLTSFRTDNGLSVSCTPIVRLGLRSGLGKDALFEWLRKTHNEGIIETTVNTHRLNSTLNDFRDRGGTIPDDLFTKFEDFSVKFNNRTKFVAKEKGKEIL